MHDIPDQTRVKLTALRERLEECGSALIAFSGGVDSTFLLKVASDVLGQRAAAATARSSTYPEREFEESRQLVASLGVRQFVLETDEVNVPGYRDNPPTRCYYCKGELFAQLQKLAGLHGFACVCDGTNADDLGDHRPGRRAAREHGVRSPLADVGLSKGEIRALSRDLGLSTWDKPAYACLASRFPYGEQITEEKLGTVDRAEGLLRDRGLGQFRVRYHGEIARIEVGPESFRAVLEIAPEIVADFKLLGFHYITLDLEGYRTGSMNEVLSEADKELGMSPVS